MAKKIEIMRKETIKPSSPTPENLKIHKLSLLDQFVPVVYVPLVLFYPAKNGESDHHKKSLKLKNSLSETLTHFYPLAGRLKDNFFIDCNDQGAEFIEAKIDFSLSEILKKPDLQALNQFLPVAMESPEAASGNLLILQATFFACGGLAIGLCLSHKLADAATLSTFIKCWSATALGSGEAVAPAYFGSPVYPPLELPIPVKSVELEQKKCRTERFLFSKSNMAALKGIFASEKVPNPTRIEAVSGLIWKTAINASKANLKFFKPSVWSIAVNMRSRFDPPWPKNYAGNCIGSINPIIKKEESEDHELELKKIIEKIRDEKENFGENYMRKIQGEKGLLSIIENVKEYGKMVMSDEIESYICSSWCNFELYEAEFGWGKPAWVSHGSTRFRNVAVLMDTRDGEGIEVLLTLSEEEMRLFECNEELLQFADVNPSVTVY